MTNPRTRKVIGAVAALNVPTPGQKKEIIRLIETNNYHKLIWLLDSQTKTNNPHSLLGRQWLALKEVIPTWMREECLSEVRA